MIKDITKQTLLASILGLTTTFCAHADFIGLYASVDGWQTSGPLDIAEKDTPTAHFEIDKKVTPSLSLAFDHPVPVIPNIKLRYNPLTIEAHGTNIPTFIYNGVPFGGAVEITSKNLTNTDAILYYRILDNLVKVSLGLDIKQLKGDLTANSKVLNVLTIKETEKLNVVIPMLYLGAGIKFPATGISLKAEASTVKYQNSSVTDAQAEVQYNFVENLAIDLGLKAGYRILNIDVKDVDNLDVKTTIKGPYLGLEAHF